VIWLIKSFDYDTALRHILTKEDLQVTKLNGLDGTEDLSEMFDNLWNEIDKILFLSKKVLIDIFYFCPKEQKLFRSGAKMIKT